MRPATRGLRESFPSSECCCDVSLAYLFGVGELVDLQGEPAARISFVFSFLEEMVAAMHAAGDHINAVLSGHNTFGRLQPAT